MVNLPFIRKARRVILRQILHRPSIKKASRLKALKKLTVSIIAKYCSLRFSVALADI